MAYVDVPDPLLNTDKPIRSTDIKQMRDNIRDLDSRLLTTQANGGTLCHFHDDDFGWGPTGLNTAFRQSFSRYGVLSDTGAGTFTQQWDPRIDNATDNHFIRGPGGVFLTPSMDFTTRVKPITFECRIRCDAWTNAVLPNHIGLCGEVFGAAPGQMYNIGMPDNAIVLLPGNVAGQWRFSCKTAGARTDGTDFPKGAINTWIVVKIIFTDVGGNQALCYIDGVLKETLVANLPTAKNLFGHVVNTTQVPDLDYISITSGGAIANAA